MRLSAVKASADKASAGKASAVKALLLPTLLLPTLFLPTPFLPTAFAARQSVYVTGTVHDFGTYVFTPALSFTIQQPGIQELGTITVEGVYNGEYPWIMRIYTENLHYTGVAGTLRRPSPAGLVSTDGQYVIPLEIHVPSYGPDVWRRIPDLLEEAYTPYRPTDDPAAETHYTDCVVMGIDPRHGPWVAGPDGQLYTGDDNVLGDTTATTPFEITVRARVDTPAVRGQYEALLYVEIVPAP